MKPTLPFFLKVFVLSGMGIFCPAFSDTPYINASAILNEGVSGSEVLIEADAAFAVLYEEDYAGVVSATDGAYEVISTEGDIRIIQGNPDLVGSGAVIAVGSDAVLTLTAGNSGSDANVYLDGRFGIRASGGGRVIVNGTDNGTVYVDSRIGAGVWAYAKNSSATINGNTVVNSVDAGLSARELGTVNINGDVDITATKGGGMYANGGTINIDGNAVVRMMGNVAAVRALAETGVITISGNLVSDNRASSSGIEGIRAVAGKVAVNGGYTHTGGMGIVADEKGKVEIKGRVDITNQVEVVGSSAVRTYNEAEVILDGGGKVSSYATGVASTLGSSVTSNGFLEITVTGTKGQHGVYSNASRISLPGGAKINLADPTGSNLMKAVESGIIQGSGQFLMTGSTLIETEGQIDLNLDSRSHWVVTGNSSLTSLSLDGTSWLSFSLLDSGSMTFANINATSIALADGAVLQLLGVKSTDFDTMGRALTTFTASLLNANTLTADGVKLVTEDNYELTFSNNADGTFSITGVTGGQLFIPEPATATLGLLGFASLLFRRRRA